METIELVIKMPREDYALIMSGRFYLCGARGNGKTITREVMESICKGTLLPSGHGRLIDADALKLTQHDIHVEAINYRHRCISVENIDEAPTIIEADK